MLALTILLLSTLGARAQYDVITQPIMAITAPGVSPQYVAGSNIGQYVVGGANSDENQGNSAATPSFYDCGSFINQKRKGASPLSIQNYPDSEIMYWDALKYEGSGLDDQKGLDTMRLFVQLHPFNELAVDGIRQTGNFVSYMNQDDSPVKDVNWKLEYNWLTHAMLWNMDTTTPQGAKYQREIWNQLAMINWDPNLEANVDWNIYIRFHDTSALWSIYGAPDDPNGGIRLSQRASHPPMDTTPFYLMTIPLDTIPINGPAGVASYGQRPVSLTLSPNPASASLEINYTIPRGGQTLLLIYDEMGNTVKAIVNGPIGAGANETTVSLANLANGHYFVRLASGGGVITKELIVQH